jgi:putative membrane protein
MIMYRIAVATAALAASLSFAQQTSAQKDRSTAQTAGESNRAMITANDKKFATEAAIGGMAEVKLGQLAAEKATDPEVKQFGERMVQDHSKAGDELKSVAGAQKIDLPTSLDAKHQAMLDRLSKLSGADFDRAYVREMVRDHDADVKSFQKQAQNGQDSSLRDFAAKTLPTLQDHQKQIHDIDRKISGKSTSADRSKQ